MQHVDYTHTVAKDCFSHMKLLLALMGVGALAAVAPSEEKQPRYESLTVIAKGGRTVTLVQKDDAKFCLEGTKKCFSVPASHYLEQVLKMYGL